MKTIGYRLGILLLLSLLASVAASAQTDAPLERSIYLSTQKATVYALLGQISEQTGYLFIYDSGVVDNEKMVKIKGGDRSVKEAVFEIIGHREVELQWIGQHILIRKMKPVSLHLSLEQPVKPLAFFKISGKLLDKQNGLPIANATVGIRGHSMGVVTNQDGEFRLHLPDSLLHRSVYFSHLGYVGQDLEASFLSGQTSVVSLEPKVVPLQEVVVRLVHPQKILRDMIEAKVRNYASQPVYLTNFYREGVELKSKLQSLTEAVFKIYKTTSFDAYSSDQVKLLKMSRLTNYDSSDTLLAKISAGIDACLDLDLMKMMPDFLSFDQIDVPFVYSSGGIAFVDNRWVNVVHFEQRKGITYPLFCGDLYIDSENNALIEAHIELSPEYVRKATDLLVRRQSKHYKFAAQKVSYTISYKPYKGTYYIHHIRGDLKFKVRKRKFLATYADLHTWFETVTCRVETQQVERFSRVERLPMRTILSDVEFKYDEAFWGDFNVIPLETEWSRVIDQVNLKIEKSME
ncbi:MAG: carboxypeptidase-like regulatory domain-containing protein [Bacteroidia bacterium]|nr:carboxypeptidase-like regulatory domain-containing protein [Bacteroidia bacterium]